MVAQRCRKLVLPTLILVLLLRSVPQRVQGRLLSTYHVLNDIFVLPDIKLRFSHCSLPISDWLVRHRCLVELCLRQGSLVIMVVSAAGSENEAALDFLGVEGLLTGGLLGVDRSVYHLLLDFHLTR